MPSRATPKRPLAALLVERGFFAGADEARRWIMAGQVLVDDRVVDKGGALVAAQAAIRVRGRQRYAGRGGYKLAAALDAFGVTVAGRVALDCGASTGGFTDCLRQRGAALVYAVEAGYGELRGHLRADPQVRNLERTNLGDLRPAALQPLPNLITLDLSYLSLTEALPQAAPLLANPGDLLALLKPLFEVEDAVVRRSGATPGVDMLVAAVHGVLEAGVAAGLQPRGAVKLALRPRHGVHEFFLHFGLGAPAASWFWDRSTIRALVEGPGVGEEAPADAAAEAAAAAGDAR